MTPPLRALRAGAAGAFCCAKIGAGSVVLDDVPAHTTVAGVPAKIVGASTEEEPCLDMNHRLS